jgi:phosphatidylserine/phosphatidylglycerophosphate/cardiolipin synthase-like enzyme
LPSSVAKAMGDPGVDTLSVFFLAQGEQSADAVMARLTTFIRAARRSLDFAVYDMRLSDPLKASLSSALHERAEAGVQIRFCYDGDKPLCPNVAAGQDPAPPGTGAFVQSLGYPWRRIAGMKLMHNKFILKDGQSVWTGSTNMTDDAFTLMENNIVEIDSSPLTNYYAEEFEQLWEKENFDYTGRIHGASVGDLCRSIGRGARHVFSRLRSGNRFRDCPARSLGAAACPHL